MKKIFSSLTTLMLTTTLAFVGHVEADTSVQFGMGYRSDDIHWKTKAPDTIRTGTFSKLNFKDLEIFTIQGRIKGTCGECTYYRIDGEYGWIEDGTLRESDTFAVPNNQPLAETNQICVFHPVLHNNANRKYVADFNLAIGFPLQQCLCPNIQLIPTIGFSYDTQRIRAKNRESVRGELGSQIAGQLDLDSCCESSSSSSSSSNSCSSSHGHSHASYRTTWWGPWIGLDFTMCHGECWNLYGELEFHWARCRRERNSCTGLDFFDDFHRTRKAYGWNLRIGSLYFFNCNWFLDGHIGTKQWSSHEKRDRVEWKSYNVGVDIGYMF